MRPKRKNPFNMSSWKYTPGSDRYRDDVSFEAWIQRIAVHTADAPLSNFRFEDLDRLELKVQHAKKIAIGRMETPNAIGHFSNQIAGNLNEGRVWKGNTVRPG